MNEKVRFETVALYTAVGNFVARVTVPVLHGPPDVLIYGVRYFTRTPEIGRYKEGMVWLVPLENMYSHPAPSRDEYEKGKKP
jgi:hypothetical protein